MEINITVHAPELVGAINNLATALSHGATHPTAATPPAQPAYLPPVPAAPAAPAYATNPAGTSATPSVVPTAPAPVPAAVPTATQPPVASSAVPQQPEPTPPTAVPTAPQSYTLDQLAVAATQLMDAGHNISALLGQFGVQALTQLPKEQYGAFATALRGLGAKI